MSRRCLRQAALVAVAVMSMASACEPEPVVEPVSTTNPVPAATRAAQLLDQLDEGDPAKIFDRRFVAHLDGGAAFFIGIRADTAIAFYCDPLGSAWLGGSHDFGQLQLVASNGVGFVGGIIAGKVEGRLSGTKARVGDVKLAETTDTIAERVGTAGRIVGPRGTCK